MPRLMSVSLTRDAVLAHQKEQTRRLGWLHARPGHIYDLCEKVMGRRHGEPLVRLAQVEVTAVRREPLNLITDHGVALEGFGPWDGSPTVDTWWPPGTVPPAHHHGYAATQFVEFFTTSMRCAPDTPVTVITWRYLPRPDDWPPL